MCECVNSLVVIRQFTNHYSLNFNFQLSIFNSLIVPWRRRGGRRYGKKLRYTIILLYGRYVEKLIYGIYDSIYYWQIGKSIYR